LSINAFYKNDPGTSPVHTWFAGCHIKTLEPFGCSAFSYSIGDTFTLFGLSWSIFGLSLNESFASFRKTHKKIKKNNFVIAEYMD